VDRHDERDLATLDDLELAHGVADRAGLVAVAHFERGVTTESKPDSSPVTVADREVEELLRAALSRARPLDAILGEEMGQTGRSSRTWIVDPIDGTNFFARKDPNWRVQIALREDERSSSQSLTSRPTDGAGGPLQAAAHGNARLPSPVLDSYASRTRATRRTPCWRSIHPTW
jgi:fructose-1,6-bisphosphatase/inositol monophosphatase family enzyme